MSTDLQALIQAGLAHERQGRLAEARRSFEAVLAAEPGHLGAMVMLGMLAVRMQDYAAAVERLTRAVALKPDFVEAHANLGNAWLALDRPAEALACYETAAALRPDLPLIRYNKGNALWRLGRLDEALACYDEVLRQKPDFASAQNNRGMVLRELRRFPEALAGLQTAVRLNPRHANAHNNIGNVMMALHRADEALPHYDRAIAHEPGHADFHQNRGLALLELRRVDEAAAAFEAAFAIKPDNDFLLGNLVYARLKACNWDGLDDWLARLEQAVTAGKRAIYSFPLLTMLDRPDLHRRAAETYVEAVCPPPAAAPAIAPAPRAEGGRLRIGYFSADFRDHAMGHLTAGLFEAHDRTRFEVYGLSFGPDRPDDPVRRRIAAAFDSFVDLRETSDAAIAQQARALGLDIAVDLMGYTQNARPGILAARCAPLQVNYLGYPGTLGSLRGRPLCDYVLADATILPTDQAPHYAEAIVHLPHSYQVNGTRRSMAARAFTRAQLGLPEDGFVYCCFNNNHKILPAMFDAWMRILAAVDGSVLWLLEDNPAAAANLRREAERRGIARERLVFAARLPMDEHLARHACADLFLDTLPYNAHTTASDALWAGLPLLTCMGQSFASRVAAGILRACGLPELVARDVADYEAMAIGFARAPGTLAVLRRRLAEAGRASPLFDTTLTARHIEAAYIAMHERRLAGLAPDMIAV